MTNYLGFICRANDILSLLKDNSDGIYLKLDIFRGHNFLNNSNTSSIILESLFPTRAVCTLNFNVPLLKSQSELRNTPDPSDPKHYKLEHQNINVLAISAADDYSNVVPSNSAGNILMAGYNNNFIDLNRIENHELIESVTNDFSSGFSSPTYKSTYDYTYYSSTAILKLLDLQFSTAPNRYSVNPNIYFIFSGSKITSGQSLRDVTNSETSTHHFTFKIQKFVDATDSLNLINNDFGYYTINGTLDSPGTSFGIPCPPDWHPDE